MAVRCSSDPPSVVAPASTPLHLRQTVVTPPHAGDHEREVRETTFCFWLGAADIAEVVELSEASNMKRSKKKLMILCSCRLRQG